MFRRWCGWVALVAATICLMIAAASADTGQKIDSQLFGGLKWRLIGPARGGRVLAVTGVRGQSEVYYFGSVNGGVWRTNDAGRTWNPIFDSQDIGSIGAIAVAPSNPQVIYVGTGEADMRSDISYGNGMYRSSDGGNTWTHIGLEDSRQIARIIVDPRNPERLFVAALGHAYGPNTERGIFYSKDGGKKWKRVLFHNENTGAIDVAFEPGNPKNMLAALLQTRRPPWNVYPPSKGPGSGLYRSTDGGEHWEQITGHGLPTVDVGRMGIAFAPSNPRRVYLIADAKEGGLYRSDDAGATWHLASGDKRIWGRGWYFEEVGVDPKDPDTVYVPNTGLYRSRDGGKTFDVIKSAPGGDDYHQLWIDPDEPQRMILGCDQGAIVTRNGGATWSSWYNQPIGQFYHVATDNRFPYWVYGAQQDSGAAATPSRGQYLSLNFHDWRPMEAGDENGYIAPDPLNPEVIFGGAVERQDLRNEQVAHLPPGLAQTEKLRRTWTLPLVFSPLDAHVLYFGSEMLFRTDDGGNSWKVISPDLTRQDPGVPPNLDAASAADTNTGAEQEKRRGVIYTVAPSSLQAGEIWAGTDDGFIQLTRDEGKTWSNVTPPELTPWSKVTHIEASHFDAATAYAAIDRHRLDDLQPYLYRTRDFGKTWQRVTSGIPEGKFLNCVREDPLRKGLLFACTEKGVYVSFDDGDSWQSLQLNMPTTSIRDLAVHEDDLVVATHGRAFWILDDAAPLRELSEKVASADLWVFRPATAYRVRPRSDQGTPVPKDEWLAENPPSGAVIDYWVKQKSRAPIHLEIFDSEGTLVRRFASDDVPAKIDQAELRVTPDWIRPEGTLPAEPGAHRFVWDLHYALPKSVHRSFYGPSGAWAVPGTYTVKLTANGKSSSQELRIKMDPRITQDALQREFRAASRVAARLGEISEAAARIQHLEEQLQTRLKDAANSTELSAALRGLQGKLEELAGPPGEEEFGFFGLILPAPEEVPIHKVAAALTGLLMIVDGTDAAATADAHTAIDKWDFAANDTLTRWKALETEVAAVNALLDRAGQKKLE